MRALLAEHLRKGKAIDEAMDLSEAKVAALWVWLTQDETACLAELHASGALSRDPQMHWEGIEVARYWEAVGKKLLTLKLYAPHPAE